MLQWIQNLIEQPYFFVGILTFSLITMMGSLILSYLFIVFAPQNYFTHENNAWFKYWPRFLTWPLLIIKNLLGFILLLIGIALLFLPGQGVLTIFIALSLLNFPYKKMLIQKFIAKPSLFKTLNKIRKKHQKPPFQKV